MVQLLNTLFLHKLYESTERVLSLSLSLSLRAKRLEDIKVRKQVLLQESINLVVDYCSALPVSSIQLNEKMLRGSNAIVGAINFVTFLISIPILAGGVWLGSRASSTDCLRFLQWPLIAIGASVMAVSLAGFAGACYRISWLMRLYLTLMLVLILALAGFVVFAFAVTDKGGGEPVVNRGYQEYHLGDYSGWLKDRVSDPGYWRKIGSCLRDAGACKGIARYVRYPVTGMTEPESADMFYQRRLSPVESGCCKPPTSCGFTYVNETLWNPSPGVAVVDDVDCTRWSNDQTMLCYNCDSCRAGVLASLRKSWRKVSVINIVLLIVLVVLYAIAVAAYRNSRRHETDEGYGVNRMTKTRPSRYQF